MNKGKKIVILMGIFLIVIFGMSPQGKEIFFLNQQNTTLEIVNEIDKGPQDEQIQFNEGLVHYSNESLFFYGRDGKEQWKVELGFNSPILKASTDYIYLFDQGTNQLVSLNNTGEIEYRYTIEGNMIAVYPGDEKFIALKERTNKGDRVLVLDVEGKAVYKISKENSHIGNVYIQENKNKIFVNTIFFDDGSLSNKIEVYCVSDHKLLETMDIKDHINYEIYSNINNDLVFINDKSIFLYKNNKINWTHEINKIAALNKVGGDQVVFYGVKDGETALFTKEAYKFMFIDMKGNIQAVEGLEEKSILGVDSNEDLVLAYSQDMLYLINKKGEIINRYRYNKDITDAYIQSSEDFIIVTDDKIYFVKI
ncbi:DUF5711 family protein [Serpentinicella sp. ANB-PHB4]|uniref:DUF5711 family protein n=1 Tax=Serpentinicella sp. ANB-PHB4 TaxID=3074076 RepID=UPI002858DF37|nr:DUF5711 family protein [Serpentinicella sp. ANB-PHB4]MDR5658892.1 DUF5711 family protein [Serpentinicella sp. ANB-PHB4]